MSSRIAPLWRGSGRCLAIRPRMTAALLPRSVAVSAVRGFADDANTTGNDRQPGSNSAQELAARLSQSTSSSQPPSSFWGPSKSTAEDVSGAAAQTTATATATETAPEKAQAPAAAGGEADTLMVAAKREALRQLGLLYSKKPAFDPVYDGHKFGLKKHQTRAALTDLNAPDNALAEEDEKADNLPGVPKLQDREDPMIKQVTRLMMQDGKLAKAQRDMAVILNVLRSSPPPRLDENFPLRPGHPPAADLPLDPIRYLTLVIDSVSPLIKIKHISGAAGGGRALPMPIPLTERQRRRTAFMWIMENVLKKQSRGSGRNMFAHRVAEELIAVAEGRSSVWEKRKLVHKVGVAARINVTTKIKVKAKKQV